jgi:hypothetical protein
VSDNELRRRYEGGLSRRVEAGPAVSIDELESLVAGRLEEGEALRVLDLVMSDRALRAEYEMLRAVSAAGKPRVPQRGRSWVMGIGLAASLLLAAGLWQVLDRLPRPGPVVRGGDSAVELLEPTEGSDVRAPVVLRWRHVEGARVYRVEILNAQGEVALTRSVPDTLLTVPRGELPAAGSYRWWVEARLPPGDVQSTLRGFTLQAP